MAELYQNRSDKAMTTLEQIQDFAKEEYFKQLEKTGDKVKATQNTRELIKKNFPDVIISRKDKTQKLGVNERHGKMRYSVREKPKKRESKVFNIFKRR